MARFENGWIAVSRDLAFGDIAQRGPITLWIWIRLLAMANYRESSAYLKGQQIRLKPGQLVTGLKELSGDGIIPLSTVRDALDYLQKTARISQTTCNQGRIITICNWDEYQNPSGDDHKQSTNDPQTDRKQPANDPQHIEQGTKNKEIHIAGEPHGADFEKANAGGKPFSPDFESLYARYPRHEGKDEGMKRLKDRFKTQEAFDLFAKGVEGFLAKCEHDGTERKFVPYWSTFVGVAKKEPWRDYVGWQPPPAKGRLTIASPPAKAPLSPQSEILAKKITDAIRAGGRGTSNLIAGCSPQVVELIEMSFGTWRSLPLEQAELSVRRELATLERGPARSPEATA